MTDFDTRLTALDRALVGASSGDFHDDVVERARAFEAYLTEKRDVEPTPEPPAEEPRPFQVGDKVLVADGAGYCVDGEFSPSKIPTPSEATIASLPDDDGDYSVRHPSRSWAFCVSPQFLTLKEGPQ